uniref:Helicase ATP-binding domain-containing protein n=1 Tax=Panagrolaimus sp. JU765 TaxID=591449 RepID=A0AC34QQH7_9BILA
MIMDGSEKQPNTPLKPVDHLSKKIPKKKTQKSKPANLLREKVKLLVSKPKKTLSSRTKRKRLDPIISDKVSPISGSPVDKAPKKKGKSLRPKSNQKLNGTAVDNNFSLPLTVFTMDEYYDFYGLKQENGRLVKIDHTDDELMEMFQRLREENVVFEVAERKYTSIMPEPYMDLLVELRLCVDKTITTKLLESIPSCKHLVGELKRKIFTVHDAISKFQVFQYLILVSEIIESDAPIASDVLVERSTSEIEVTNSNLELVSNEMYVIEVAARKRHVIELEFSAESFAKAEGVLRPMLSLTLIKESDVVDKNTNAMAICVTVVDIPKFDRKQKKFIVLATFSQQKLQYFRDFFESERVSVFVLPSFNTTLACRLTFQNIQKDDVRFKVFPKIESDRKMKVERFERVMSWRIDSFFKDVEKPFNEKQKKAIYSIVQPANSTFILFGPPGTGKTYTLVESIRILTKDRKKKILVCAPSNMAADAISEALLKRNFMDTEDIFRVMSSSRDAFTRNHRLDTIVKMSNLVGPNGSVLRPIYELPNFNALEKYQIIICTLGSCPRLSKAGLEPGHFSHIFIDEAAQSPEMESWLAIGLFATKQTRIIIAGDPKQLGPVATVDCLYEPKHGFKTSLLKRLYTQDYFKNDPRHMVQLTENHRSHRAIVKIYSDFFYDGTLVPTDPKGHDSLCRIGMVPNGMFPIIFHSITTGVEQVSQTLSKANMAEVEMVCKYVVLLTTEYRVKDEDIGIVAPYNFQRDKICEKIGRQHKDIVVGSVEKFQGSEKRVIILSTVRTSTLGFMADDLRFNTAISRAKQLLIVIGNEATFNKQKMWKKFIDICKSNNSFARGKTIKKDHNHNIIHKLENLTI